MFSHKATKEYVGFRNYHKVFVIYYFDDNQIKTKHGKTARKKAAGHDDRSDGNKN